MAQKANIIRSLELMGYSVGGRRGLYVVSLQTNNGMRISRMYSEDELTYGNFIVEKIVGDINKAIIEGV